jgi:signal peptidase I
MTHPLPGVDPPFGRVVGAWAKALLVVIAVWVLARTFLLEAYRIPSGSMANTLLEGDLLFVNKAIYGAQVPFAHWFLPACREPRRGDLLIFDSVEESERRVVKRLVGLPGDTLAMRDGRLYRDGVEVEEPYTRHDYPEKSESLENRFRMRTWQLPYLIQTDTATYDPDVQQWGPLVVPRDSVFVLGDNREDSYDSRYWGFVPRRNLRGRPVLIYYSYDPGSRRWLPFLTAVRGSRLFTAPR